MALVAISPLSFPAVRSVAWRMRAADWREICAVSSFEEPDALARSACAASRFGAVLSWSGSPVCALGAVEPWPGTFVVWMFATDDWPLVSLPATRWARRIMTPLLRQHAHRVMCQSIADHQRAHAWLRLLGLREECRLPRYGKNGETFIQFARTREAPDVLRRLPSTTASAAAARAAAAAPAGAEPGSGD